MDICPVTLVIRRRRKKRKKLKTFHERILIIISFVHTEYVHSVNCKTKVSGG